MPAPVILGTTRVAFNWLLAGQLFNAANVMHFGADSTEVDDLLAAIQSNWTANMFKWTSVNGKIVRLVGQNLDGVSAAQEVDTSATILAIGGGNGEAMLQVAGIIKFKTGLSGKEHRGRVYLPWVAENMQDSGAMANVSTVQSAWETFRTNMNAAGFPLQVASYKLATASNVTTLLAEDRTATQRRRNKR